MGDGQPLPGSSAGLLGRKEKVEYSMANRLGNPDPGVADPNFSPIPIATGADGNRALFR